MINSSPSKAATVEYFFVGVGKCGTSWIYEIARKFDLFSVPSIKEPYLIDQTPAKREKSIKSYYSRDEAMADFSNVYYWDPQNAEKICEYNSDAKIIITMRKPSRRVISHFKFLKRNGMFTNQTLQQYLENGDPEHLIPRTQYREIIARYRQQFSDDQILLLPLELLKESPQAYLDRLMDFCGLPSTTLEEADKQPVLQQSEPRNALVARTAKSLAVLIRKVGLLGLLSRLKDSKLIAGLLFRETKGKQNMDTSFGSLTEEIEELDRDYEALLDSIGLN